jgi:hypothetical protein
MREELPDWPSRVLPKAIVAKAEEPKSPRTRVRTEVICIVWITVW